MLDMRHLAELVRESTKLVQAIRELVEAIEKAERSQGK